MKNRVVYINTGFTSFEMDHLDEWALIKPTGVMDYAEFFHNKLKEIGLIPLKYMEYEVIDEQKFMLAVIKYGIKSYNLNEVVCGIDT